MIIVLATFLATFAVAFFAYSLSPRFDSSAYPELAIFSFLVATVAAAISLVIVTSQAERRSIFSRHLWWFPGLLGIGSYFLFTWSAQRAVGSVDHNFYSTAAQVIPVLILALILDVRYSSHLAGRDIAATILAAIAGETIAFEAIAFTDFREDWAFGVVSAALVTLGAGLVMALSTGS